MNIKQDMTQIIQPALERVLGSLPNAEADTILGGWDMHSILQANVFPAQSSSWISKLEIVVKPISISPQGEIQYRILVLDYKPSRRIIIDTTDTANRIVPLVATDIRRVWAQNTRKASLRSLAIRLAHVNTALRPHLLRILNEQE